MGFISEFLADPRNVLIAFLLALPGRLFAISAHEYAHARAADKVGDPTARYLGRLTLNPLKHLDPVGTLMMLLVGFGWARPVPVNPRNFKGDFRKADLKVSVAGVWMNFRLFLAGAVALYAIVGVALAGLQTVSEVLAAFKSGIFLTTIDGAKALVVNDSYVRVRDLLTYVPYFGEFFIRPLWGDVPYYLFQMLSYFVQVNIVLAIFNLFPIPPLDGYHALNDLVLKRDLFGRR